MGGVNPAFFGFNARSQYDSWLTIGRTDGDADTDISAVQMDFGMWTADAGLVVDNGAIFFSDPQSAPAVPQHESIVVAQLTVESADSRRSIQSVRMNVQGSCRDASLPDWHQSDVAFAL